jgi:G3E family GTPase
VGCSLASSLVDLKKQLKRNVDPDLLFIEPSEMVVTQELRNVAAMGLRDIDYQTGPFITLVDGPLFEFLWSERRALLLGQVEDADLVAISRVDLIGDDELRNIGNVLKDYCDPLILSVHEGACVKEMVNLIG